MLDNSKTVAFTHEQMNLEYIQTEMGLWQTVFNPQKGLCTLQAPAAFPNFQIAVAGMPHGFMPALVSGVTFLPSEMHMISCCEDKDGFIMQYRHDRLEILVDVKMQFIRGANMIRQITSVSNEGVKPVVLTHLSSAYINGIAADGLRPWYDSRKIKVNYCIQTWEGEGQWRKSNLEDLGLYPTSVHQCAGNIRFTSVGSFSTAKYLPMVVMEDEETGKVWYVQVESSAGWNIEIGYRHPDDSDVGGLFMHAGGCSERHGGWSKKLMPGETYTTIPVAFGCCMGGFTEAVRELTKYRRLVLKPKNAWEEECPVFFNDYMNCLWADPTEEKLIPLIDAAAEAGCDGFCIDAGWFAQKDSFWGYRLGDWNPSQDRFGMNGLKGIINYIKSKGMIPGIWLEMEVCGEDAELGKKEDHWFIRRNGKRVGGGSRWFLDFTKAEVREYMHRVINQLVDMGIGFIKNDYNDCIGNGDDILSESAAEGLVQHINAFYNFIDEVRSKHPQLILENCGSGAMRQDYGVLSHFHLQSTSDQEIYYLYPSIIGGSLAGLLPEQAGIWAYPYPLLYSDRYRSEILESQEYRKKMEDGEQTVFNMVNGMCGNLYLSGRIEKADKLNRELIREAVVLYKQERKHIHHSFPVWPIGFTKINDRNAWACVGFANQDNSRLLLAVWRLASAEDVMELPIAGWLGKKASIRQLYPGKGFECESYYNEIKGSVVVKFSKNYQARFFELCALQSC